MHTVYIHIDEKLDETAMKALRGDLQKMHHVTDVEIDSKKPHDFLIEFEEGHISPMAILKEFSRHGLHADIVSA